MIAPSPRSPSKSRCAAIATALRRLVLPAAMLAAVATSWLASSWPNPALAETPQAPAPSAPVLAAADSAALREHIGQTIIAEGRVERVGRTAEGGITFLNFGPRGSGALVGVIFQRSYHAFPDGFDHFANRMVRIEGPLSLYENETPQIVIEHPSQIQLLD